MLPIKCWKNITFIQFVFLLLLSFSTLSQDTFPLFVHFSINITTESIFPRKMFCSPRARTGVRKYIFMYFLHIYISFAFHKYIYRISPLSLYRDNIYPDFKMYAIIIHVIRGNRIFFVNILSSLHWFFECVSFVIFSWFPLILTLTKANDKI